MLDIFRNHPFISAALIGLSSHFITTAFFKLGVKLTGTDQEPIGYWKALLINIIFAFVCGIGLTILLAPLIAVPLCGIIVWFALIPTLVFPAWGFVLSRFFPISWFKAAFLIGFSFIGSMVICAGMTLALIASLAAASS